jgi:hypothetical protein
LWSKRKKISVAINQCRRPGYRSFLNPEKGLISITAGTTRGWQAGDFLALARDPD